MVTSIITCRDGTSSFFSACSMIEYSDGVATISSVFWSLSATTWMLRTTPTPSAPPTDRRARRSADRRACRGSRRAVTADACGVLRRDRGLGLERRRRDDLPRRRARRERRRPGRTSAASCGR